MHYPYPRLSKKSLNKSRKENSDSLRSWSTQMRSPFFWITCGELDLNIDRSLKHVDWTVVFDEIALNKCTNKC